MALARVHDRQAGGAPRGEQRLVRLDGAAQLRDVVAEHLAEAARLEEIALHVDDEQRGLRRDEFEGVRFGLDVQAGGSSVRGHGHCGVWRGGAAARGALAWPVPRFSARVETSLKSAD